jgi:hypothetical protein
MRRDNGGRSLDNRRIKIEMREIVQWQGGGVDVCVDGVANGRVERRA